MRRIPFAVAALVLAVSVPAAAAPGPASAPEYWFDSWKIPTLWDAGVRGQGVTIGEIDTGVNARLPELSGRILSGTDLGVGGNGQTDRDVKGFGHGTAMASLMVARAGLFDITGLAPAARVLPVAVPLNGTTDAGQPDNLAEAITYAADHGAKVISMSLGGTRSPKYDPEPCPTDEQQAIFHALSRDVVVVASVGNTGPTANTIEDPGVCLGVVAVGSVDQAGTVAKFSARQPYLSLVAPGVDVPTLARVAGQAYSGNGTSQSTAITAAVVALIRSKYPKLSGCAVVTRLLATLADHRTTPSPAYGYGQLDAYRAVTAAVPANAPNPVYDAVAPFLQRSAAAGKGAIAPPRAVATRPLRAGPYVVGSVSRVTTTVRMGIALAAAGALALIVVLGLGLYRRRARVAAARAMPPVRPLPGWPVPDRSPYYRSPTEQAPRYQPPPYDYRPPDDP